MVGEYYVIWKVVLSDGYLMFGEYFFIVMVGDSGMVVLMVVLISVVLE